METELECTNESDRKVGSFSEMISQYAKIALLPLHAYFHVQAVYFDF